MKPKFVQQEVWREDLLRPLGGQTSQWWTTSDQAKQVYMMIDQAKQVNDD
jgi:hypothetical protein